MNLQGLKLGVLITKKTFRKLENQTVPHRINSLANAGKQIDINLYFFSIIELDIKSKSITGLYWSDKDNLWLKNDFPLPDILYLRSTPGKMYKGKFSKLIKEINIKKGLIINYPAFDKIDVFKKLNTVELAQKYLPDTTPFKSFNTLKIMLTKYTCVYLKASQGRKGQQVMRIKRDCNCGFEYSYYLQSKINAKGKIIKRKADSFGQLRLPISNFFKNNSVLIQKGIELLEFDGSPIDLRAELQRTKYGKVKITGISVRVGKVNSPITTHFKAYEFGAFFKNKLNYSQQRIEHLKTKIYRFLFIIYYCLEYHYGEYGEIGIDFAVDHNDKIWFIESNSQSTKVSLERSHNKETYSKSYIDLLEYAVNKYEKHNEQQI
ncbi:YheC/YheD family protein [Proteinivorax hydrogeniformans]|uniref:YheC/YheD family protein n=1 Tax=Proteinivorax hydrogeniformans TaxID=1826727 RepID=A0AAU8HV25_9FIRM